MAGVLIWFSLIPVVLLSSQALAEGGPQILASNPADSYITSDNYVSKWIALPNLKGEDLNGQPIEVKLKKGYVEVVVFLATSCIPCQQLMQPLLALQEKYSKLNTHFTYVFSHDTSQDAREFARVYGVREGVLAGNELLARYHDPRLPTIYVQDRWGLMEKRFDPINAKNLPQLEERLKLLTCF